ncbi:MULTISPECIES: hypothetical protein [unclassified Polaromonas]|jgi:hypothetical protein|uniref:hypothetical protein n=1 Tax=unclassified Polaromonas TaxID=2638319 RepID=UPI000BD29CAD|nr:MULTISPECIES: hypothetical protein [unclassified Polaromonas]OYY34789.1 MAG: hypothetical protein B7Y60_15230 [Polaromonas sp. 35-63-35]OYZ19324.1 MAG: hypothetical protein B7Y28_12360 [Polaromonas sp. 16-63-31]OYZ77550.1 MAG: hypothetical protein B7Y09_16390 [Polaromonas sp. 24-63-21]OZA48467.1 MAG: hypothetical protein B7X88_18130 [Polaromonas sp. 17-63-33]OZA87215.1 MAG: hypothetical protein B7X65_13600 [Polaromonas sp. 39-63-25]
MPWIGPAIGLVGGLLSDGGDEGGQQQQQTVSKDPWSSAAPWLQENIKSGQALQGQYAANPFNAQQVQGYNNQYGNADYMRSLTSSVLGQLNGFQPFDRGNQDARPQTFQFPAPQKIAAPSPYMQAPIPAPVVQQAVAAPAPTQAAPSPMDAVPADYKAAYSGWRDLMRSQYGVTDPSQLSYDYYRTFYGGGPANPENAGPGVGGY